MGGVKAKRHLFPSCREPEGSTCIIAQHNECVNLCFVMTTVSPIAGRRPFFICPSFAQKRPCEPFCVWVGNGSGKGAEGQDGGKAERADHVREVVEMVGVIFVVSRN